MKKYKLGLFFSLILILGIFSFPQPSFASDSGDTAREVAQDATQTEWDKMLASVSHSPITLTPGDSRTITFPDNFQFDCNDYKRNEYSYSGTATIVITNMTSSDPNTLAVSYSKNSIQLMRGFGSSDKVTITMEYHYDWSFHVQEDTFVGWVTVNDKFGPSGTFSDSFDLDVNQLTVTPKPNNKVELNMFSTTTYTPLDFVTFSGNTGTVVGSFLRKPDDSKLGQTQARATYSDGKNTVTLDIPIIIVDTIPPNGSLKNPIEVEAGIPPSDNDLFASLPFDNDLQDVHVYISSNVDLNNLGIGNYPLTVYLEDSSQNSTELSSTIEVKDTTPPKVKTKDLSIEYGDTVLPSDFIDSATDNDTSGKISYLFDVANGSAPDTQKVGEQTIKILVSDKTGNSTTVTAKLTVKPDKISPTATGKKQFVEQNESLPTDVLSVLESIKDNGPIDMLAAKYISVPDTSKIGLTEAIVQLSDVTGNYSDIKIPVFVIPKYSVHDDDSILAADNFTVYSDQINLSNAQELEKLIIDKANAKAWKVVDGTDISSQITISKQNVQNKFGSYSATLSVESINKTITINVLDSKDLVDASLPKKIVYGSTDINKGTIISPSYEISNNSSVGLKISLEKVLVDSTSTITLLKDNDPVPLEKEESVKLFLISELANNSIAIQQPSVTKTIGTLLAGKKTNFTLNGKYYGTYLNQGVLDLNLVFKLEAVH